MRGVGRRPAQRCRDTFGFPGQRYRRVGGTRQFLVGGEHVVEDLAQCMGSRIGGTGACAAGAISPICRSEALEDRSILPITSWTTPASESMPPISSVASPVRNMRYRISHIHAGDARGSMTVFEGNTSLSSLSPWGMIKRKREVLT
jgi:hypothetical protein